MEFQCANIIKYLVLLKCVLVDGSDRLDNNYVIRLQVITIVAIIVIRIIAYGQMNWIASRYELEYYIRNVHAQYRATLGWLSNQSLFQFGSWKFSVQNLNHNDFYDVGINKNLVFDSPSACGLSTRIISRYLESKAWNSNIFNLMKSFNATMRQMPYKGIDFECIFRSFIQFGISALMK